MRRLIAIGAAIGAGLAAVSAMLVVSPASADHETSKVEPTVLPGNQSCADVKPDAFELKIEPVPSGETKHAFTFDDVSGTVTLDVNDPLFDFSIDGAVAISVLVKGGPNTNWYDYQPGGVTSDVDLHAPINPRTDEPHGLSHISFCLVEPPTGALLIEKLSSKTDDFVTNEGAEFSYTNGSSGTVIDNGEGDEHPDIGLICVSDLEPGAYTVTETAAPEGYAIVNGTATANVVGGTDCEEENLPAAGDRAVFENAPLFDIQTNFRDGGSGETSLVSIDCNGFDHLDDPATEGWDDSQTNEGIAFTSDDTTMTITCEIVVDP
jgi:hypothetical protein